VIRVLVLPLFLVTSIHASADEAPRAAGDANEILRDDATLNDVTFVDGECGWAVGNRGVILHSADGGRTWQVQSSETDATLEAVHFVDRRVGYAVGGRTRPDGLGSYGVLLRTEDGGQTWQSVDGVQTGWLHAVWAGRTGRGWVLGEPTPMRDAGVWRFSRMSLRPRPATRRKTPSVLAASFGRDGRGIAIGPGGAYFDIAEGEVTVRQRAVLFRGRLTGVAMAGPRRACMVGDDGTILVSSDSGRTWRSVRLDVPVGVRELMDLTDVAFADAERGWATGANGRYVVRTVDGGETWRVLTTGLPGPLRSIHAIDAQIVVGVGERGLVGRSEDGGVTWSAARNGDRRTGALVLAGASASWVYPLMAHLVGESQCRTAFLRITDDGTSFGPIRWAANACGVSSIEALRDFAEPRLGWAGPTTSPSVRRPRPVPSYIGLFRHWSDALDRDAEEAMQRQIIAAVRNLQPTLVVTDEGDPNAGGDLVASSVAWLAWEAIDQAGRPDACPEQRQIGLMPHRVQRVAALVGMDVPRRRRGVGGPKKAIRVGFAGAFCPLLGSDSRLAGLRAAGYFGLAPEQGALSAVFRVVRDAAPPKRLGRLLSGVRLPIGARYPIAAAGDASHLEELKSITDALVVAGRMGALRGNPAHVAQLARRAARRFPGHPAPADALYQVARQLERSGQSSAAAEVWRAFLNAGRSHPAWTRMAIRRTAVGASAEHYMCLPIKPGDPLAGARAGLDRLDGLCAADPYLVHQPAVLFARAHTHRVLGQLDLARPLYDRCAGCDAAGWSTAAAGELWLMKSRVAREAHCPRPLIKARRSAGRVQVDGRLDEPVWRRSGLQVLVDARGQPPDESHRTRVGLAWDATYLYLAAMVQTTHGRTGPPAEHQPTRDRLDDAWPAIEWFIDVDRDAATYFHLAVDEIGNALDTHNDDVSFGLPLRTTPAAGAWQYVIQHDQDGWTVEMTVPMACIFPRPPTAGQVWAIQIRRRPELDAPRTATQWLSPQPDLQVAPQYFALLAF